MKHHGHLPSPVGDLLLVADDTALRGLWFSNHWWDPEVGELGERIEVPDHPVLRDSARQLGEYFAGRRREFDLEVAFEGSAFNERIWTLLQDVAYGTTTSYGALAVEMGDRNLAQQVGYAVGHNPISIVIPCHRVIGADGSLTGFGGGLDRKRFLLGLEEPAAEEVGRLF